MGRIMNVLSIMCIVCSFVFLGAALISLKFEFINSNFINLFVGVAIILYVVGVTARLLFVREKRAEYKLYVAKLFKKYHFEFYKRITVKKLVGTSFSVLVVLSLFLVGPINFSNPLSTLSQTNVYGYGTSHHHSSGGGGSGGGSPYVPFFGRNETTSSVINYSSVVNVTNATVVNSTPLVIQTPPTPMPIPVPVPPVIAPPVVNDTVKVGFLSSIGGFFKSSWAWFVHLF